MRSGSIAEVFCTFSAVLSLLRKSSKSINILTRAGEKEQGIFHLDLWMEGKNVAFRTISHGIEKPLAFTSMDLAPTRRSPSARAHVYIFSLITTFINTCP